ncbi:tRNA(Met) cytidine acetyltransferase TmcA [Spongorhabdus nitratireducens]
MTPDNLTLLQDHLALVGSLDFRSTLIISGEVAWCRETAETVLAHFGWTDCLRLSDQEEAGTADIFVVPMKKSRSLLGQECDALFFDAHSGFDADAFGIAAGLIKKGGLLILLTPAFDAWTQAEDPQAKRLAVYPEAKNRADNNYIQRLLDILSEEPSAVVFKQSEQILETPESLPAPAAGQLETGGSIESEDPACLTCDQQQAVQAIIKVARGHRRRPLVLTADRGRGKSAALGIASGRLLDDGCGTIIVTAPSKDAANVIFTQAEANCKKLDSRLRFMAPDELMLEQPDADLVLVDEAAAIPVPVLTKLLKRYARIAFASTVHGYEGAGRGFAVRFQKILDDITPQWRAMKMEHPVRWALGDPLEQMTFRMLLLDAAPADISGFDSLVAGDCEIQRLNRKQLAKDEPLLRQIFGLLVLAHYRTSPQDLRILLDGPNISVIVMRYQGQVVATALIAAEGGIDSELAEAIWRGDRRVRGHLLPQTLAHHAGFPDAASLKGERVVRIAVHPELQGKGFGSRLVKYLATRAASSGLDWFGTSFGASPEVVGFWQSCNLQPVRVGITREASSGSHSVVMIRALTPGSRQVFEAMRRRFSEILLDDLGGPLDKVEIEVVWQLFRGLSSLISQPSDVDWRDARSFAESRRGLDLCRLGIRRILTAFLAADKQPEMTFSGLSAAQQALIMKVFQHARWDELARFLELTGRRQVEQALREAMKVWLEQYPPA